MDKLQEVINEIDAINQKDPRTVPFKSGNIAQEYLYSLRMSYMLKNYDPEANELLQIAARGQHIRRWAVPRGEYPMDRQGYLKWRKELKVMHAKLIAQLMQRHGYSKSDIDKVKVLIAKQKLKTDTDSQKLEDVVCLVFLRYYAEDFAREHPDAKVVDIFRKTWNKMTDKGHAIATNLQIPPTVRKLMTEALNFA